MSPERHHWMPAVQAAAVMLRTPPVDGQLRASQPRPLPIYGVQFWERPPRHPPVTGQQRAHTPPSVCTMLSYHGMDTRVPVMLPSHATRARIANPPNSVQLGGSLYHAPKLLPGPCNSVGIWPRTDRQTDRRAWPQYILRRLRLTQNVTRTHQEMR